MQDKSRMERVNDPFRKRCELSKTFVAFVLRLSVPVSSPGEFRGLFVNRRHCR